MNKLIKYFQEKRAIKGQLRKITAMYNSTNQVVKSAKGTGNL